MNATFGSGTFFLQSVQQQVDRMNLALALRILALGWVKLERGFRNELKILICALYIILFCK